MACDLLCLPSSPKAGLNTPRFFCAFCLQAAAAYEAQLAEAKAAATAQQEALRRASEALAAQLTVEHSKQVAALEQQLAESKWELEVAAERATLAVADAAWARSALERAQAQATASAEELAPSLQAELDALKAVNEQDAAELRMAFNAMLQVRWGCMCWALLEPVQCFV